MSIADKYREGFDFFELGFCSEIIKKKKKIRKKKKQRGKGGKEREDPKR